MKVHFIGIGGIGVSALAQYYLSKGHQVSGSDLVASEITDFLEKKGVKIFNFQSSIINEFSNYNFHFPDLVIYSPAVKPENSELKFYKKNGIKCLSYPKALGELTKEYFTIAIAGAHGKSTTTAMIALILTKAGLDPTVIVGTKLKEFNGSNFRAGKSKYLVIEACEYDSSFLHYLPKIIAITNIDKEHLDYFKTFANVKKSFKDFIVQLPENGFLILNKDDKYLPKLGKVKFKTIGYSLKQKEAGKLKKILKVPGQHNVSNALAALQVARILAIPDKISFGALSEFNGTWRRFEERDFKIKNEPYGEQAIKLKIISDYAHHPNEILATLKAVREKYSNKIIWCVFQPHQYQRTYYLFNDFVKIFREASASWRINNIIITDIYDVAGRETKTINKQVSSEKLVKKINRKNVKYFLLQNIEKYIKKNIKNGDVLIIMGAGDIYKLADKF